MAVPSFDSLMLPVLQTLVDGNVHRPQEVSERVAVQLGVSVGDQAEMLPSGAMPRYRNRILWALHYMKRAGVIASPGRGQYVIADSGRALLAEAPAKVTIKMLERYPGYVEFTGRSAPKSQEDTIDKEVATPEERLQAAYEELRDHVAAEVLERLRAVDPLRFERIVLEVLTAM
jgi:restriction system protein